MLSKFDLDPNVLLETIHSLSGFTLMIHDRFVPVYVKEDYARLYGFSSTEEFMALASILELIPEELHPLAQQRYDEVLRNGSSEAMTVKTQDISGLQFWIKLQDRRIRIKGRDCVLTALIEITDEVELQENFKSLANAEKQQRKQLERLQAAEIEREKQQALNQLLIGVSHQMNTPLGNILTSNTIVENILTRALTKLQNKQLTQSELVRSLSDALETVVALEKSALRASKLIKDVKLMVSDSTYIEKTNFYLAPMIKDSILLFTRDKSTTDIQINVDIDDNFYAHANPHSWMKIINALCDNSIQHAFVGRQFGTISVSAKITANDFIFSFADDGVGIDLNDQNHVFEAFYSTQMGTSSGLGLTLVYSLVHRVLAGSIAIKTPSNGLGVEFQIKLPLADYGIAKSI